MSYEHRSIREIIDRIGRNEIYLPAIQRKFVWKYDQITSLFDSIMRGYPIGTFLFWFIRGEKKEEYTFYKFLKNYHERDNYLNDIAPKPELKEEIIGILDGQQRLSSMYTALQGTYAYRKPYARRKNDFSFPQRKLYLNLLTDSKGELEEDYEYEFKFLTDDETDQADENHLWFLVRSVLIWGEDPDIDDYYDSLAEKDIPSNIREIIKAKRSHIKKSLRILHKRIVLDKLVSYFIIKEQDLDNILDIFVRVNSGGTILSKSDLLFSTIIANWQEGRQEIETYLNHINNKGNKFWFDTDFIMRSYLVLTDSPVLFKVRSFKKENIEKIRAQWKNIKLAISKTVDMLVEFGFSGENLTSQNAIIPITYYFFKGGVDNQSSKAAIRKYLVHSLLKQIYGSQGDQALTNIRECLRRENGKEFSLRKNIFKFEQVANVNLSGNKSLKITQEDLDEIIEYKKGPYTFMVLSLLYPHLKFNQVDFHQDHIHPANLFTDAKLKKNGIETEDWQKWQQMKDHLPNLQLMEGKENESKNKTPFEEWLNNKSEIVDIEKFKTDNHIPINISLDFKDFEVFYDARRNTLRKKIETLLL